MWYLSSDLSVEEKPAVQESRGKTLHAEGMEKRKGSAARTNLEDLSVCEIENNNKLLSTYIM